MLKLEGKIFPPHPRTLFIDFRERNVERERGREGGREGGGGSIDVRK